MKSFKQAIFIWVAKVVILAFIRFVYFTSKKEFIGTQSANSESLVILFWHNRLALMPFITKKWFINRRLTMMISSHKDGEIISGVIKKFGVASIRGSSYKGAIKVFLEAINKLNDGFCIGITPDGPRGPVYSISNGSVTIAQKTGAKLVWVHYEASRFWKFKSWDGMILPKPFSKITYFLSQPFSVENLELEAAKELIKSKSIKC